MRKIIGYLLIIGLLFACNQKQNTVFYKIEQTHTLKLPLPNKRISHAHTWRIVEEQGKKYAIVYYYPYNKLVKYDTERQTIVKEFPFPEHLYMIFSFDYINKDSIWILGSMPQTFACDSQLVLINDKGTLKKIAHLKHPYLINETIASKLEYGTKPYHLAMDTLLQPFWNRKSMCCNQKLILGFYNSNIGKTPDIRTFPMVGIYDVPRDSFYFNNKINIPTNNVYYPNPAYYPYIQIHNGTLSLSLSMTPNIQEWDILNKEYSSYSLKSLYLDSIYQSEQPIDKEFNDLGKLPGYSQPIFLNTSDLIIRPVILSQKYGYNRTLIVADTNGKVLDEFLCNQYLSVWDNELCHTYVREGALVIDFFDIVQTDENHHTEKQLKLIKDSVQSVYDKVSCNISDGKSLKSDIKNYLEQQNIQDSNCSVILIDASGCTSCIQQTLNFIANNQNVLFNITSNPMRFIFVDEDFKHAEEILKNSGINQLDNVQIDTSQFYDAFYSGGEQNPRLILKKDDKIIHDSIYNPDCIEQLQLDLLDFYQFGYEKK